MIALAILFCTLVYIFLDKPEVFSRPIKPVKVFIVIILALIAIFSAIKDYTTDISETKAHQTIDSLQGESKVLFTVIDTLRKDNANAAKDYDSLLGAHNKSTLELLAKYGLKMDSLRNKIDKQETLPTLTIEDKPIIEQINGELAVKYILQSFNSDAYITSYDYALINVSSINGDGSLNIEDPQRIKGRSMNLTSIIRSATSMGFWVFMNRVPVFSDECFLAIEVQYKSKGEKMQSPLRKIYHIYSNRTKLEEADNELFNQISAQLKESKIWP